MSIGTPSTNTSGSLFPNVETPRMLMEAPSAPGKPEPCVTFKPVIPPCNDCDRFVIGRLFRFLEISSEATEEMEFNFFSSENPVTITSSSSSVSSDIDTVKLLIARLTTYSCVLNPR